MLSFRNNFYNDIIDNRNIIDINLNDQNNYNNYNDNNFINRDNYYFNNNNKINEGAKKLYNILNNFKNLTRIQKIDFERNLEQVFNNRNIFSEINHVFRELGFSKEKTINFLIFKYIISVSGTKMNHISNELLQIKNEIDIIKEFNKKKNILQGEFDSLKIEYKAQQEKLETLKVLTDKAEQCIPVEAKCSICISNTKSHIIVPCGHKSICGDCAPKILNAGMCPICRTSIQSIIKVYEA